MGGLDLTLLYTTIGVVLGTPANSVSSVAGLSVSITTIHAGTDAVWTS